MMQLWHRLRGYLAAGVALVACPCHLPLTVPLLLALTGGTALGVWLAAHQGVIFVASAVLFLAGLGLWLRWLGSPPRSPACRVPAESDRRFEPALDEGPNVAAPGAVSGKTLANEHAPPLHVGFRGRTGVRRTLTIFRRSDDDREKTRSGA